MKKYAILCGSAQQGFRQKKMYDMYDFLLTDEGGAFLEGNICVFPNGINELMLECVLNSVIDGDSEKSVILYFFTNSPISKDAKTFLLNDFEIRKDVLSYYADLAKKCDISWHVVYEVDQNFVNEQSLGFLKM